MASEDKTINVANRASEVALDRLWFLDSMDQLSRAMQDTEDLEQLSHVLETVLSIFACDRAWLAYPSDADSRRWRTVAQRACPELADTPSLDLDLPMDPELAEVFRLVEASEVAVRFGADGNPLSSVLAKRFGARSQMCLAIHPKIDRPYTFGLDHCQSPRIWTRQEQELFEAAGKRLATLLTSLLLSRDLQESKARLEEAQRVAHVGYWDWNVETNVVVWSDETYRIFGVERGERPLDFAMVRALVHPEDREALYSTVDVELDAGVHPVADFRIVTPSGEMRTVHAITSKLWSALPGDPGKTGKTHRLFGTVQDITELKRAEEARHALSRDLQESRAWLEEAQRVAHLGYWVWDLDSNRVIWSKETSRIFGLAPQVASMDIAGVSEMFHPDDREAIFRTAEEAIRSGTRADCEHRLVRPDGEVRVVHSLGDVKTNSEGRAQMFGTTQDITDRKHAEEERQSLASALQQSNARLEEAQRVAHIGHYEWNLIDSRVDWSKELYRIYGLPPQEGPIDLARVFEMIHPDDRESVAREAEETIRSGIHIKTEHRIVRADGEVRYLVSLGTVKRDASGRAYEMFGTGQDITERKLAEHSLRRSQFYLSEGERLAHMGSWASSDLGISWSDELGIYWSDEVYKIFGFDRTKGAPNLQQFFAAIHPQDRDRLAEAMKQLHERHCGCDITSRIIRPDGQIRYVRCVGIPVVEDGIFKGYHGTTIDVTEHELLTLELRREQAYLAEAQRLAHAGSWASNLVTRQVFHSSEENNRLYGFDVSQYTNPFDLHYSTILAEDEPALRAKLENAIRAGKDFDLEYRIRRADGAIRFLRGIGHHSPGQDLGEYFGITIDITDRKLVEQEREALSNALQQSNAYLAEAQSLTHVGSWACNLVTQQILHSSEENARMYGFDPSQGS